MGNADKETKGRTAQRRRTKRHAPGQSAAEILESVTDTFLALDREWRFTYLNERALGRVRRAKGEELTREDVVGKTLWGMFPGLVGSVFYHKYHEALREQKAVHFEAYSPPSGGWVEVHVYPSEEGMSVYARDITERKRVAERLAYHAYLLENVHDAVIATDERLAVTAWNKGAQEMYGWRADEVLGRHIWGVVPVALSAEQRVEAFRELHERGRFRTEAVTYRKDGMPVYVEGVTIALRGGQGEGQITGYVNIRRDITERKRAEEALRTAQAELAHVTRVTTLGELMASIAHEVNQPLGAIVTNGEACQRLLARDAPDLDGALEAVGAMIGDASRASQVIMRMRAFLKKAAPEHAPLDLNETIRGVVSLASGELVKNQVSLRTELEPGLPPVLGDRFQLQQVALNLLLNGVEAMSGEGGQPRELLVSSKRSRPDEVTVAVRDTGGGINPRDAGRIFDAFFTTKGGGPGLGLTISRTIIEAHGGRLWATPNDGRGMTFQFTLPVSRL